MCTETNDIAPSVEGSLLKREDTLHTDTSDRVKLAKTAVAASAFFSFISAPVRKMSII
jgi:hypothetical protein